MNLPPLDIVVIVVYLAAVSSIGLYFSKRQVNRTEYFLGNRSVHWLLAGGSIMATLLSALTYLMAPGEMIRHGSGFFAGVFALPLVIPVVSRVLLPLFMRLPITSAYEYLQERFDGRVRRIAAAAFSFRIIIWMGLIIYTASFAFTEILGVPGYWTILVIGLICTFYTSLGGLKTVIWTDNVQLWILFGGAIAIPVVVWFWVGGGPLEWWWAHVQTGRTEIQLFSFDPAVRITIVGIVAAQFFWNICTHGGDQVAVQRYLSTPSLRAARRSLWVFAICNGVIVVLLMICGLALFYFYAQQAGSSLDAFHREVAPEADGLMPRFILHELPTGVSGLLMAAILAAAMSSLSSGINSVSGVVLTDWWRSTGSRRGDLSLEKAVSLGAGVLGTVAALFIGAAMDASDWNLVDLVQRVNHVFVAPIAVLFFGGMLFRKIGTTGILSAFVVSTCASVFICFGREWFGMERSISFMWVVPAPFLFGLLIVYVADRCVSRSTKEIERLTVYGISTPSRPSVEKADSPERGPTDLPWKEG
jgi:solute:Na+ symporter, SSS family